MQTNLKKPSESVLCSSVEDTLPIIDEISKRYEINIHSQFSNNVLPKIYLNSNAKGKIVPINPVNLCRAIDLIEKEINLYATKPIKQVLKNIYLADKLSFYQVEYGGTAIGDSLYLTVGSVEQGYSDKYIAELFHHELSSLFFHYLAFDKSTWKNANPENFKYLESDKEVLAQVAKGDVNHYSTQNYENGFLSEYGKTNLENDFNTYAEVLMTEPEKLEALAKRYSRINMKLVLVQNFYSLLLIE
ncbi:hypothetical protein [Aliikangiella maris]|uniref:Uncharacterized protein n=2 Tax=Aliikangiella maris TaxID=3162458 RepID=A0ABV3MR05_9GAMM